MTNLKRMPAGFCCGAPKGEITLPHMAGVVYVKGFVPAEFYCREKGNHNKGLRDQAGSPVQVPVGKTTVP